MSKTMKEVANVLNVSVGTVGYHKYTIKRLLNARTSAELVAYAIKNHVLVASRATQLEASLET